MMKKLLITNLIVALAVNIMVCHAQTPAGNNQDIQFNNNGSFGASPYLKWTGSFLSLLDLGSTSAKLHFNSGSSDNSYIYSENFGANLNRLVIETADDGDQDYTVFRNKHWSDGIKDVFEVHRSWVKANSNFYVENGNVGIGTTSTLAKLHIKQPIDDATGGFALQDTAGRLIKIYGEGSAGRQVIGTYATLNPLAFELNGIERMRIKSNGNVGIGVEDPKYSLHVSSGARFRKTSISVTGATAENSWIRDDWLTGSYGPPKWDQTLTKWVRPSGTYNDIGGVIFQDEGTYFIRDRAGTQLEYTNQEFLQKAYLFAHAANGNVGIGTITPDEKLDVNGNILANKLILNDPNRATDWNTLWQSGFYESYNATNAPEDNGWFWGLNMNHVSNSATNKYNGQIAIKNSSTTPTMYFRSTASDGTGVWSKIIHETGDQFINGDLGIGTDNTEGYELAVKGKIITQEVKVALYANWSDFVFKSNYNLPSLQEVETHIKEKGHLKDIPSAAEVAKNGFYLGEMDAKLLQKIEELTLYTIEQDKRIKTLEQENKDYKLQSQRIKQLEAQMVLLLKTIEITDKN